MRKVVVLLALVAVAACGESTPVEVVRVVDAVTIEVKAPLGDIALPVRVRLRHVSLPLTFTKPEQMAESQRMLAQLVPVGSSVVLVGEGDVSLDQLGRVPALVAVQTKVTDHRERVFVQERLVRSGLYRCADSDRAAFPYDALLHEAQGQAIQEKLGGWKDDAEPAVITPPRPVPPPVDDK